MSLLNSLWPYLVAAGAAAIALWRILANAKQAGINEQKVKEAAAREKDIQQIKKASDAAAAVRPDDGGMSVDPYNRDRAK